MRIIPVSIELILRGNRMDNNSSDNEFDVIVVGAGASAWLKNFHSRVSYLSADLFNRGSIELGWSN
jgi:hypothetical protein